MPGVIHIEVHLKDTGSITSGNQQRTFKKITFYFNNLDAAKQKYAELVNHKSINLQELSIKFRLPTIHIIEPSISVDWGQIDSKLFYQASQYPRDQVVASGESIIRFVTNQISLDELRKSQLSVAQADDLGRLLAEISSSIMQITINSEQGSVPEEFTKHYVGSLLKRLKDDSAGLVDIPKAIPDRLKDSIIQGFARQIRLTAYNTKTQINAATSHFFRAFQEEASSDLSLPAKEDSKPSEEPLSLFVPSSAT
ncbi:hypothetical protein [Legionella quinlivanii]|uniref:hypothetical protein n=1 Tax=Legionella quinlivanii TaxID=45073 RepID=UPI00224367FA|nr:hypothetical protein [Legionella quinlivanii]MCW8451503.1 hypothetical protein [Legionella quinlivanii]